jgi:pimeloyl-ACP methyl ester carboxylesterase
VAAARVRLWEIAVRASQALWASNRPEAGGPTAVDELSEDLLDDGVAAVVRFGLDASPNGAGGERGVIAPHVEQRTMGVHAGLVQVGNAAHDQTAGDLILIIHGDDDQIVPIGASAMKSSKIVKGAELKVYPGAPHGLTSTMKDTFQTDLLTFLRS